MRFSMKEAPVSAATCLHCHDGKRGVGEVERLVEGAAAWLHQQLDGAVGEGRAADGVPGHVRAVPACCVHCAFWGKALLAQPHTRRGSCRGCSSLRSPGVAPGSRPVKLTNSGAATERSEPVREPQTSVTRADSCLPGCPQLSSHCGKAWCFDGRSQGGPQRNTAVRRASALEAQRDCVLHLEQYAAAASPCVLEEVCRYPHAVRLPGGRDKAQAAAECGGGVGADGLLCIRHGGGASVLHARLACRPERQGLLDEGAGQAPAIDAGREVITTDCCAPRPHSGSLPSGARMPTASPKSSGAAPPICDASVAAASPPLPAAGGGPKGSCASSVCPPTRVLAARMRMSSLGRCMALGQAHNFVQRQLAIKEVLPGLQQASQRARVAKFRTKQYLSSKGSGCLQFVCAPRNESPAPRQSLTDSSPLGHSPYARAEV